MDFEVDIEVGRGLCSIGIGAVFNDTVGEVQDDGLLALISSIACAEDKTWWTGEWSFMLIYSRI